MSRGPVIRVECTLELLTELHQAHEALTRSLVKRREPSDVPHLQRLMVQVAAARMKVEPPPGEKRADA